MNAIEQVTDILEELYRHNWDERNGGNLSYILEEKEVIDIVHNIKEIREIKIKFDVSELVGKYFIVTGTGKYFRNARRWPEENLGILKVKDDHTLSVVWGFKDGGNPTSELPTHLKCHIERLRVDPNHRLIIHCHPTNVITMTHIHDLSSNKFTETLWKMQTESIVVFPDGVTVLPWMLCGGEEIGDATAAKMKEARSVVWSFHGLFCAGTNLDEVFGLVETIEKAAEIYVKTGGKINYSIKNEELVVLANYFKVNYKKGIID